MNSRFLERPMQKSTINGNALLAHKAREAEYQAQLLIGHERAIAMAERNFTIARRDQLVKEAEEAARLSSLRQRMNAIRRTSDTG